MTYQKNGLFVDEGHLEAWAENCARSQLPDRFGSGRDEAAALRSTLRELAKLHWALTAKWQDERGTPPAARWILDNDYLARREGAVAAAAFEGCRELRRCGTRSLLLGLCEGLLRSGQLRLNEARLRLFLRGFQRSLALEWAELGLLGAGLRAALLDALLPLYRRAAEDEQPPELETSLSRAFTALRWCAATDLTALALAEDPVEQTLREDPARLYARMDEASRADYRAALARLARINGLPEAQAAQRVLTLARGGSGAKAHVGWWLYRAPLGRPEQKPRQGGGYLAANVLASLFLALLLAFASGDPLPFPLLLLPVSELVRTALDFLLLRLTRPVRLPRLELPQGLPPEGRTLCVISALLTSAKDGERLAKRLEECALLSRDAGAELRYAILADLPDSAEEAYPDADAILTAAAKAVEALDRRCGGGFYLLTRSRRRNADGLWGGWERKRGALTETMRYLRGRESGVRVLCGDAAALSNVRFLLVLDSDTRLSPGAARSLVGTMLHPLNAPVLDEERGVVRSGYGILAPRLGVYLTDATRTDFSRVFAGQGGVDPYDGSCGELWMDLFDCGNFAGKGLIDVDAALRCLEGRIPEGELLSHDAVEGGFLRAGYVGDVELSDGFPAKALSYYARLDRWTRGDWQNLPWLFRRGRDLAPLRRWRLFDSLRRSLLAPAIFNALLCGFLLPGRGWTLAAAAAGLALFTELLSLAADALLRRDSSPQRPFSPALFLGAGGALARTLLRLLLLPAEAATCSLAAARALWRLLVTRRRLLEWRTAAQSESLGSGLTAHYAALWSAPLAGLVLLLFATGALGKAVGLLWLLTPLCAYLLSLPNPEAPELRAKDRAWLLKAARETWRYFDEHMGPEDHFLPPDNDQRRPPTGVAHRTSPTNIGLGLLSCFAAIDLGFVTRDAGLARIEACLGTVEALPKLRGHLYNWYQTETLAPLTPRYVSTVDSGNLCACLIALRAGLTELGRTDLADRADALAGAMRFDWLVDPRRMLLHIGYDAERDALSEGHYDLLCSEARLTAYLAVARGDAPRTLWRRMSRAQLVCGRRRGMASWTGTAFEYLMPELLLPLLPHSLLHESARFCLYVQRRRGRTMRAPWGCSESAYGALDPAMCYRYKAHGCAALALRRDMDEEYVVSPYSSFLALAVKPRAALRNLRRLEALDLRGPWGFWEAYDLTPARCPEGEGLRVRCAMAHHQGMSLLAAANLLSGGAMIRRFTADPAMAAYRLLLEEKAPWSAPALRRPPQRPRPAAAKPRGPAEDWSRAGAGTDLLRPACCLLAGEDYSLLVTETGLTRALWGRLSPYVPGRSPLDAEHGIDLALELDGRVLPLLPAPDGDDLPFQWRFTSDRAVLESEQAGVKSTVEIAVSRAAVGERREIRLRSERGAEDAAVELRFRPILAALRDYDAQPAFCALGLSARTEDGALLLRRLARGTQRELVLCLAASAPISVSLSPSRNAGRAGLPVQAGPEERFLTDPLLVVRCPVSLPPRGEFPLRFALALGLSAEEALAGARVILNETDAAALPGTAAAVLGLDRAARDAACELLPELCFPTAPRGACSRAALWRFGLSGDLPIVVSRFGGPEDLDRAAALMDRHLYLCGCGQDFDLVFFTKGEGYRSELREALERSLRRRGGELLRDRLGGIHLIEEGDGTEAVVNAAAVVEPDAAPRPVRQTAYRTLSLPRPAPSRTAPEGRWGPDGSFALALRGTLPPRAWQNVLSNGRLGCIMTECGSGNLWYRNAREHPLTPWNGRPYAAEGPERLLLEMPDGSYVNLFAGASGETAARWRFGAVEYLSRRGALSVRMSAFVPPDIDARVLLLSLEGPTEGCYLRWRTLLQLCPERADARYTLCQLDGTMLRAENPCATVTAEPFWCAVTGGVGEYSFSRAEADAGRYSGLEPDTEIPLIRRFTPPSPQGEGQGPVLPLGGELSPQATDAGSSSSRSNGSRARSSSEPAFALRTPVSKETVLVLGVGEPARLRALTEPAAAREALQRTLSHWSALLGRLRSESPAPSLDRLANGWLADQVLACRLLGRCSLYQNGGAFGFRDQLQDAVNLILLDAAPARAQLLRCCAHQYAAGDVQHWWHELGGGSRGVRTRCGDDLLWLPWAVAEYVAKTGDRALLDETIPYLDSPPLAPEERDRYEDAVPGGEAGTVLDHCRRALALVRARGFGPHGLLRFGSGDWNDGFDRVGGESVWLSWFYLICADRFAALVKPDPAAAQFSERLTGALDAAWDGKWYLRGWYADGKPLGSSANRECRIDALAQAFAALSGRADPKKVRVALSEAVKLLHDPAARLVKLFAPPFAGGEDPGYLVSYGPGFRENGGQYTHGAVWLVLALLRFGEVETAWTLLRDLLPGGREPLTYGAEPFILAADVSTADGHAGEAGWSWYTGAAGWLLRLVYEELYGLKLEGGLLYLRPRLPAALSNGSVTVRGRRIEYRDGAVLVDGQPWDGAGIAL